jgi:hypothetical protein
VPKEHKPGWLYFKSDILNKEFAFHEETGWVYFEDGVRYSPDEWRILGEAGGIVEPALHNAKLVFGGEIVRYEPGTGTIDKGKSDERSGAENKNDNSSSGESVPKNKYEISEPRPREFDIY